LLAHITRSVSNKENRLRLLEADKEEIVEIFQEGNAACLVQGKEGGDFAC